MIMTKAEKQEWIDALKSGKYKQGQTYLRAGDRFCCLGVLCELQNIESEIDYFDKNNTYSYGENNDRTVLPTKLVIKFKTTPRGDIYAPKNLSYYNDSGVSFQSIADIIDKYVIEE